MTNRRFTPYSFTIKIATMAKQKGIIKLEGTIGDITFLKTQDGYIAKEKSGVSGDRIATDPVFQRTRENGAEFGRAGKAGKMLRNSLRSLLQKARDRRMVSRLTKEMMRVIQADTTSTRGLRNVIDGEAELLTDFNFNENAKLSTTLYAPFITTVNRATGELSVQLPPFVPGNMIAAPAGTTHFRFISGGSEVDFEGGIYVSDVKESALLPWDGTATAVLNLVHTVTANSTHPLFIALGIEFLQEVNGQQYPLKNGSFNSLALVKVDGN
jgi:hypothetical protein